MSSTLLYETALHERNRIVIRRPTSRRFHALGKNYTARTADSAGLQQNFVIRRRAQYVEIGESYTAHPGKKGEGQQFANG